MQATPTNAVAAEVINAQTDLASQVKSPPSPMSTENPSREYLGQGASPKPKGMRWENDTNGVFTRRAQRATEVRTALDHPQEDRTRRSHSTVLYRKNIRHQLGSFGIVDLPQPSKRMRRGHDNLCASTRRAPKNRQVQAAQVEPGEATTWKAFHGPPLCSTGWEHVTIMCIHPEDTEATAWTVQEYHMVKPGKVPPTVRVQLR